MRIVISSSDLLRHWFARNWFGLGLAPGAVSRWTIPRGVLLSRWAPPGARRVEEAKVLSTSLNTAGNSGVTIASRLGITAGSLVLELGRQDDSDEALRAQITDQSNGGQNVTASEYYVDVPPWRGGAWFSASRHNGIPSFLILSRISTYPLRDSCACPPCRWLVCIALGIASIP